MRAVILAAGRGGRLSGVVGDRPKGLAVAGDCTLLERQIRVLRACGVDRIAVVAGFRAADVRQVCGPTVEIVENRRFATTNSLYSLWLARHLLADGFVVLNCDVLFHPQLLIDLLTARYEDALLVSAKADGADYSDEEMKVRVRRGLVIAIDKSMPSWRADGENVGIAKFGAAGAACLIAEMAGIVRGAGLQHWLPRAFGAFAAKRSLHVVETRGFPWIEIDFPEDYWRALTDVLPAIDANARWHAQEPAHPAVVRSGSGRTMRHL
jgi:L-glutamine-phosphate cytidylyltransferase